MVYKACIVSFLLLAFSISSRAQGTVVTTDTTRFFYIPSGNSDTPTVQSYTIPPDTDSLLILTRGADGAGNPRSGAIMRIMFVAGFTPGQVLDVIVGRKGGTSATGGVGGSYAGGAGTAVKPQGSTMLANPDESIFVAAGGGGGAGVAATGPMGSCPGQDATADRVLVRTGTNSDGSPIFSLIYTSNWRGGNGGSVSGGARTHGQGGAGSGSTGTPGSPTSPFDGGTGLGAGGGSRYGGHSLTTPTINIPNSGGALGPVGFGGGGGSSPEGAGGGGGYGGGGGGGTGPFTGFLSSQLCGGGGGGSFFPSLSPNTSYTNIRGQMAKGGPASAVAGRTTHGLVRIIAYRSMRSSTPIAPPAAAIPTLSEWGLIILLITMAIMGVAAIRSPKTVWQTEDIE